MNLIPHPVRSALHRSLAASLLATVLALPGHASVIDTSGGTLAGFVLGSGSIVQTFVAPSDNFLKELQFFVAPLVAGAGTDGVMLDIRRWSGNNEFGGFLFARPFLTRPVEGGAMTVSDIDLELIEGELYGFRLNFFTYRDRTAAFVNNLYTDGMLQVRGNGSGGGSYTPFTNLDLRFVATFAAAAPAPNDVPEPGSALLSSFALAALAVLRRKTRAAPASALVARATT